MTRVSIAMVLMAEVLVGCGQAETSRRENIPTPEAKFDELEIPGIPLGNTQSEVREKYGSPQRVRVEEDGSEIWTYRNPKVQFPLETFRSDGNAGSNNQRITQAPTLTMLDDVHVERSIKMGQSIPFAEQLATVDQDGNVTVTLEEKAATKAVDFYFRDGKLVKVEVDFLIDARGELRATTDMDGKVTWTSQDEKGKADDEQGK